VVNASVDHFTEFLMLGQGETVTDEIPPLFLPNVMK
jgi:hypothetical protein